MTKTRLLTIIVLLGLMIIMFGACSESTPSPTTSTPTETSIKNVTEARDDVLSYLHENIWEEVPAAGVTWEERNITPEGLVGQTTIEFNASNYWEVTVSYPVVAPQNIVYDVLVTNHETGWHWQGEVRPNGSIEETGQEKPEGTLIVSELLSDPIYDTEVKIYGRVDGLGELMCSCFFLISGRESVQVWYDTMVENDGTVRPAVSVEGIENGDQVIVTGELKRGGTHHSLNDFWASSIEING